ncbi:putative tafazzin protein [Phaeoacremonium minimum UCRPA7]|uniref:Tafazzin family protein n=1 Tax=Phaeoacremonium minimum (strain UCR-PA7) TaxID=1286976 RepID=R8BYI7_PHAM7|nr:putative tafazzin protein [Phaeoacremonium minimum UCRPA7]EOO04385.1 putative tafazzin protein [Phaeoacremonium minimum UCRPA7]
MERFLELLEARKNPWSRERGLITVSNHISVLDDPLMWGVLPLKNDFEPSNLRWGLGAHDICFANKALSTFFSVGQVLPTHRGFHSPLGGLFQPTMTQAIRLLSSAPYTPKIPGETAEAPSLANVRFDVPDPFSTGSLTYSTTGQDLFVAPSAYWLNRHSWVHIFPEGGVHQHATRSMRYFKWGIARLILEAEPMPDVVPMFIDGTCDMMPEDRTWPRFVPRAGKHVRVAFGEAVDTEKVFGDLRTRWQGLVAKSRKAAAAKQEKGDGSAQGKEVMLIGDLPDDLKYSKEAEEIRIEVAQRVRNEVLKSMVSSYIEASVMMINQ